MWVAVNPDHCSINHDRHLISEICTMFLACMESLAVRMSFEDLNFDTINLRL